MQYYPYTLVINTSHPLAKVHVLITRVQSLPCTSLCPSFALLFRTFFFTCLLTPLIHQPSSNIPQLLPCIFVNSTQLMHYKTIFTLFGSAHRLPALALVVTSRPAHCTSPRPICFTASQTFMLMLLVKSLTIASLSALIANLPFCTEWVDQQLLR